MSRSRLRDRAAAGEMLRWAPVILTLLAFALRVYHLDYQSLWRDEADALLFANADWRTVLGNFVKVGENGPLYFLLLRFWVGLIGDSEFSLRYSSLAFGTLIVPLTYTVGRHLLSREVAAFAALIAAVSPYYVWYSQEAKMYALLAFLSLLSVYLFWLALQRQRTWLWATYVLITSLSLYIHFFSVLVVAFEGLWFLARLLDGRVAVRPGAIALGALTLPYLPLAVWQLPTLLKPPPTAYPFLDPSGILSVLILDWSFGSTALPLLLPMCFFVFLLLAGLFLYPNQETAQRARAGGKQGAAERYLSSALLFCSSVPILAAYLLLPIVGFYLVSLRLPLFADRYLIIVSPAYYLLLACGLAGVRQRSTVAVMLCLIFLASLSAYSLGLQSQTTIKSDFTSAARYYAERVEDREPVMFVMPYAQRTFSYYHRAPVPTRPAPHTNEGATSDEVAAQLQHAVQGERRLWLLMSEAELYDSRGLVKAWFDANARLLDSETFVRVALYRYDVTSELTHTRWLPLLTAEQE